MAFDNLYVSFENLDKMIQYQPKFSLYKDIVFSVLPSAPTRPLAECTPDQIDQALELQAEIPANMQFLSYKRELRNSLNFVTESETKYGTLPTRLRLKAITLRRYFEQELLSIDNSLQSEWERQRWVSLEASTHYVDMS